MFIILLDLICKICSRNFIFQIYFQFLLLLLFNLLFLLYLLKYLFNSIEFMVFNKEHAIDNDVWKKRFYGRVGQTHFLMESWRNHPKASRKFYFTSVRQYSA